MASNESTSNIQDEDKQQQALIHSECHPSVYGDLGRFPKEVRDMIYAATFASGSTAVEQLSKHIHADAQEALSKHGVCRLNLRSHVSGDDIETSCVDKHHKGLPSLLSGARNLQLKIGCASRESLLLAFDPGFSSSWSRLNIGIIKLKKLMRELVGSMNRHEHCHVVTSLGPYAFGTATAAAMDVLRPFKSVTIEYRNDPWANGDSVESKWSPITNINNAEQFARVTKAIRRLLRHDEESKTGPKLTIVQRDAPLDVTAEFRALVAEKYNVDARWGGAEPQEPVIEGMA